MRFRHDALPIFPDQIMFLAFAGEELGEDGGGKCRIVELDRQIGALVLRLLFPGGADFGLADEDAVAGGVAARIVFRNDANQFRSEEHTSELQSLMRISYAVFCLKKNKHI